MKFSPDDPKLTAYALGELPENERKEIERELQTSPELRAALDDIRQTTDLLKKEFSAEPALTFSAEEKEAVVNRSGDVSSPDLLLGATDRGRDVPSPGNIVPLRSRVFWATAGIGAIAASLLFFVMWQFQFSQKPARVELAQGTRSIAPRENLSSLNTPSDVLRSEKNESITPTISEQESVLSSPPQIGPEPPVSLAANTKENKPADVPEAPQPEPVLPPQTVALGTEAPIVLENSLDSKLGDLEKSVPQEVAAKAGKETSITAGTTGQSYGVSTLAGAPPAQPNAVSSLPRVLIAQNGTGGNTTRNGSGVNYVTKSKKQFSDLGVEEAISKTPRPGAKSEVYYAEASKAAPAKSSRQTLSRSLRGSVDLYAQKESEVQMGGGKIESDGSREWKKNKNDYRWYDRSAGETARYPKYVENAFESVLQNPLSTFSIDVDTASYANVRRFLTGGQLPPHDAVRVEELINYFSYNYPQPKGDEPFSANIEIAGCPWDTQHRLVRVGLKGREMAENKRPPSNFVFLIDVSGSMSPAERLPLIKQSLRMLVKRMTENDRIAIVVYASSSGTVLESTSCANKEKILEALDRLEAGGSTNGGEGIQRAYGLAEENFIKGGVNRVILCTDGDFNVGITDQGDLIDLIQRKAKNGVFLSALGVGTDNFKDALLQKLADKGNGNYHYIDTMEEAQKVLVQQMNGTLVTIAKDVKIQIEFNPAQVASYRLIGYEKRILEAEDFNNDKKDAGEIGAGHTVTALYEIVPAGAEENERPRVAVDDLKYQNKLAPKPVKREVSNDNKELLTLKLRWKKPDGDKSKLTEFTATDRKEKFSQASTDFKFAAAVASFGMILKDSEHKGDANFRSVLELAEESKGDDTEGYRAEFINLVKKAKEISRNDR